MQTADGRLVVTFNGEIYNYRALRSKLEAKGYVFRSKSDTEVLLHLYVELGDEMLHELRGMFAFAIWDSERSSCFWRVIHMGSSRCTTPTMARRCALRRRSKRYGWPVTFRTTPTPQAGLGSTCLAACPSPSRRTARCASFQPDHLCALIERGMHSHPVPLDREKLTAKRKEQRSRLQRKRAKAQIRDALLDSVRHHLVADVPVGAFLSAGIDSHALVGLMRDAGQQDIQTVTLAFDEFRGTRTTRRPRPGGRELLRNPTHDAGRHEDEFRADLPSDYGGHGSAVDRRHQHLVRKQGRA